MARRYRIPIKSNGELDCSNVTVNPGEQYTIFVHPGDGGEMVHEVVVTSELEDEAKQNWIRDMIHANVGTTVHDDNPTYDPYELAEFIQRRLLDHDPTYACHEIPFPNTEDDWEKD